MGACLQSATVNQQNTPRPMALSDTRIKAHKPRDKDYTVFDEKGLYLLVRKSGGKLWRFKYRVDGREKSLSIGSYPDKGLAEARADLDEARKRLAAGIDPSAFKQAEKQKKTYDFDAVANEFLKAVDAGLIPKTTWSAGSRRDRVSRLDKDLRPWLGKTPMESITRDDLDRCLKRIADRGALETARRCKQLFGKIARFGISKGYCTRDAAAELRDAYPKQRAKHHAAIKTPGEAGAIMRVISGYKGSLITRIALAFSAYTFQRPTEVRHAEWLEIDLNGAVWRIPGAKMKMRRDHIVPLSRQVIELLEEIKPLTGGKGVYVFPSDRSYTRPMSENTVNGAIRRMGYSKGEMTAHGFRGMASTLLNERGYNADWIEKQLAHDEANESRASYNHAEFLAERRRMMQEYADYLDELASDGSNVIPLGKSVA